MRILFISIAICLISWLPCALFADNPEGKTDSSNSIFGIKIGYSGATDVNSEGYSRYQKDEGLSGGFFVDYPLNNALIIGIYGDLHRVKVNEYDEKSAIEFGGMFKLTLPSRAKRVFLRPGIGLGGAMLQSIGNAGVTYYLTYRAAIELHCKFGRKLGILGELALFGSPVGGGDVISLTVEPMLLARLGMTI